MPHYEVFPIIADAQFPALVHAHQPSALRWNGFSLIPLFDRPHTF
ncbi:hypothetical protein VCHENC01_0651 [Vibrio harveyi]|nr:hypothetical protein VCHENC01_0651 [Vibrio harveyi]